MNQADLEISCREVKQKLDNRERFTLLDCREAEELAVAKLRQARHIPMGDIAKRIGELDPEDEIVVLCHHGRRSLMVAGFLLQQGFKNVKSMRGGIDQWAQTIDPAVPVY